MGPSNASRNGPEKPRHLFCERKEKEEGFASAATWVSDLALVVGTVEVFAVPTDRETRIDQGHDI